MRANAVCLSGSCVDSRRKQVVKPSFDHSLPLHVDGYGLCDRLSQNRSYEVPNVKTCFFLDLH